MSPAAVTPGGVAGHAGHVIGKHEAIEAHLVEGVHHLEEVHVGLVDEALGVAGHLALHPAEVRVEADRGALD